MLINYISPDQKAAVDWLIGWLVLLLRGQLNNDLDSLQPLLVLVPHSVGQILHKTKNQQYALEWKTYTKKPHVLVLTYSLNRRSSLEIPREQCSNHLLDLGQHIGSDFSRNHLRIENLDGGGHHLYLTLFTRGTQLSK